MIELLMALAALVLFVGGGYLIGSRCSRRDRQMLIVAVSLAAFVPLLMALAWASTFIADRLSQSPGVLVNGYTGPYYLPMVWFATLLFLVGTAASAVFPRQSH